MKRFFIVMIPLLLVSLLFPSALAAEYQPLIVDNAQILRLSEEEALLSLSQTLQQEYETDVVILTIESLNGISAQTYADDFFDANGYGYGDSEDGILFLLAMQEREWYISTCGNTIYAVTDYGIQLLGESAIPYFSEGNYYSGFYAYLEKLAVLLDAYAQGIPLDGYADDSGDHYHGERKETVYYSGNGEPNYVLSIIIGIAAATVVIVLMRRPMNTRKAQRTATDYLKPGSYHLHTHQDLFLYSNVNKVRKQQNTGSGGGGSSVHRSSGGRCHGGGGGRF